MKALLVDAKDFRKEIELPDGYPSQYVEVFENPVIFYGKNETPSTTN